MKGPALWVHYTNNINKKSNVKIREILKGIEAYPGEDNYMLGYDTAWDCAAF